MMRLASIMVCLGLLALLGGLGWIYPPLAPIVGGLILLLAGVTVYRELAMQRRRAEAQATRTPKLGESA